MTTINKYNLLHRIDLISAIKMSNINIVIDYHGTSTQDSDKLNMQLSGTRIHDKLENINTIKNFNYH